ncbi:MAG: SPOR domain-containing protein [Candidatus Aminicenantaceae bacterium]
MRQKNYRELQISSSLLVFIFLGMLVVCIIIFLLGVSVGKKQAQITATSGVSSPKEVTQVEEKKPVPAQEQKDLISKELESHQKFKEEAKKQKVQPENLYYIQVGAFSNKEAALSLADQFKKEGYPCLVSEPFTTDKKPTYRVRIGGYATKEEAARIKTKLQSSSRKRKDYFIIKG